MQRFLIIRFSSIGDIVLTSPVIRCIYNQIKNVEIHYLTKNIYESCLKFNPYIKELHFIEDKDCIKKLKEIEFDAVIDLHHNLRSLKIKKAINAPAHSFNKLNVEKWLHVNFKWNTLPHIHIVDRYMKTVKTFGVTNDFHGLDFFLSPDAENIFKKYSYLKDEKYIAVAVGAGHGTKQLPTNKMIEVLEKIKVQIVLLGGLQDQAKGLELEKNCKGKILNLCGQVSLQESAAVVKNAYKVLTHDTGLMHIAAAFKKDIITIWGNTIPYFGMGAYLSGQNSYDAEVFNLPCRPCSKIGFDSCPKKHFNCMLKQDTDLIALKLM